MTNSNTDIEEQMLKYKIWQKNCPIALDRLKVLDITYLDFYQEVRNDGKIMVLDIAAESVKNIFKTLYEKNFPIQKIALIHHYKGDDDLSMADNNSSAFNYRKISGSSQLSIHSYGLAIDINPLQNPFIVFTDKIKGKAQIYPPAGYNFVNRKTITKGMLEPVVDIFYQNGFTVWGGDWTDPVDFHHFQTPRNIAEILSVLDFDTGTAFWNMYLNHKDELLNIDQKKVKIIIQNYLKDQNKLNNLLVEITSKSKFKSICDLYLNFT